jgi:aminopeptidase N
MSGGTEHASAIFYGEKGVSAGRGPVVHEVAHQWWGNSVTEKDWDDIWLSEGFATYFAHLYTEQFSGRDAFVRALKADIKIVLQTQRAMPDQPIIHRNISNMDNVLNRLVYQKAGWVLHMLRGQVGTEKFWTGIRDYYRRYRNLSASTDDFRRVMEQASGKDLTWFFDQWLKRPGMPKLAGTWRYDATARAIVIDIRQTHAGSPYRLPIEVGVTSEPGSQMRVESIELAGAEGRFTINAAGEPQAVVLDPNTWLLAESADLVKQ